MTKLILALVLCMSTLSSFASENWRLDSIQGYSPAHTFKDFLRLQKMHPKLFPQDVSEIGFQFAGVREYFWLYVGSSACDVNDARLQVKTFTAHLCLFEGCTASPVMPKPAVEDPCLE